MAYISQTTFQNGFPSIKMLYISIKILLEFVPNISVLVQIMARCRSCDKPLSEPMMVS